MQLVEPKIFIIGETKSEDEGFKAFLKHVGAPEWMSDTGSAVELLPEEYGRLCYRSWEPGLNPNVTKVRQGNKIYLAHILEVGHGSVLEHSSVNFIFADVSRVFTHELVRHRVGVGISQESMRFVRLDRLPFWFPPWAQSDPELMERSHKVLGILEEHQLWMAKHFGLDEPGKKFDEKKKKTSFMRRFAPEGVATSIGWSGNIRTIRHCIEMRTDPGAEEEIRLVFGKVAKLMQERYPNLFNDYEIEVVDGLPHYKTKHRKV
jgi:thymidylate synthase (FAD)